MTSRDFCYWLQGFFEVSNTKEITPEQLIVIKNHLNMVFKHEIDPSFGDKKAQEELCKVHQGHGLLGGAGNLSTSQLDALKHAINC